MREAQTEVLSEENTGEFPQGEKIEEEPRSQGIYIVLDGSNMKTTKLF
jgi:hypothetical protein